MRALARIERLERTVPPLDMSPEGRRARLLELLKRDSEAFDMVARMGRVLHNKYRGASPDEHQRLKREDPYLRLLQARFDARAAEISAGAPLKDDHHERFQRMFQRLPPPDWPGAWVGESL